MKLIEAESAEGIDAIDAPIYRGVFVTDVIAKVSIVSRLRRIREPPGPRPITRIGPRKSVSRVVGSMLAPTSPTAITQGKDGAASHTF